MKQFEEERLISTNVDLGWLFNLPDGVFRVYYGNLLFCGRTYLHNIGGRITFEQLYNWMKDGPARLLEKIEDFKETVLKDYDEAKEYLNKHRKLMKEYDIKEIEGYVDGGKFKIHLIFENYQLDLFFGYYFRTNNIYEDGGRLLRILHKLVAEGKEGVKKYNEWLKVACVLEEHDINIGWFRYFRINKGKIYLKGKDWLSGYPELATKLVDMCDKRTYTYKRSDYSMDYDDIEVFRTTLDLLEG